MQASCWCFPFSFSLAFPSSDMIHFSAHTEAPPIDCSFELRYGEFLGLYGPTGSGKTTILRMLAGLNNAARITVDGVVWDRSVPPQAREVGMVFQDYAL